MWIDGLIYRVYRFENTLSAELIKKRLEEYLSSLKNDGYVLKKIDCQIEEVENEIVYTLVLEKKKYGC